MKIKARSSLQFLVFSFVLLVGGLSIPKHSQARELECRALPELFKFYLANHFAVRRNNEELENKVAEQFIKRIDGPKTLLLKSDVETAQKNIRKTFDNMKNGDCKAIVTIRDLAIKRSEENEKFVKKFLGKSYKMDESTQFVVDPDKRDYPKDEKERQALLKKFIHFQISNYLSSDMKLKEAKSKIIHRYELVTKRLKERNAVDIYNIFVDSFATGLDPHSSFFSKDKLEDFRIEMSLSLEGIGASLSSQDGYTVVEEIIPGGAAARAEVLQPKDKILSVAQDKKKFENVIDMDLSDVVKLIRGKKGTKVRLKILRQGDKAERLEVTIVRDKIDLKDQAAKIEYKNLKRGEKTYKVGILDLPSFYGDGSGKRSSYKDVKKLLEDASKKKVDGLVLNLSRNGGGLLEDAYKIGGLFIKKGPIVATKNAAGQVEELTDTDEGIAYSGPLVVLISRVSASASEILAGALKDYNRAIIVGADHTFGKGSVQTVVPLPPELGAIKVTNGMFFLPAGKSTQHDGVQGDIFIPSPLNNEKIGEKTLDNSLPPQKIASFLSKDANFTDKVKRWTPVDVNSLQTLGLRSKKRIASSDKLQEIQKDLAKAMEDDGVVKLSELLEKNKKDKDKDDEKSFKERIKDADAPIIGEAENILVDLVQLQTGKELSPIAKVVVSSKEKVEKN